MASRHEIEMNYEQAIEQAKKLEEAATSLSNLSRSKFNNTLQNIRASWSGESADYYLTCGNKLQTNMNKTSSELSSLASDLRRIAKNIYDAEMENWRRAQRHRHH